MVVGLFISGLGLQIRTLGKVSDTVISIDKKVAVLYDREERNPDNSKKKKINIKSDKVKSCLVLAENHQQ